MKLEELEGVQTNFFDNLLLLQKKQGHGGLSSFIHQVVADAPKTYFFDRGRPFFRIYCTNNQYRFIDEQEKIDVRLDSSGMNRLHNIMKDTGKMRGMEKNLTILDSLLLDFQEGKMREIAGKPFLVYDIETTYGQGQGQYFEIAYGISSGDNHGSELSYNYVDRSSMKDFADMLLSFDGRVIGYNGIGFDNPVLFQNCNYDESKLLQLHEKSLDPFLLLYKLTGRRMSLNNVSQALIGTGKTLSSGSEGSDYLKKYKETGDERFLDKVKDYCKNDVEITLGVVLYILAYKKIQFDGKVYNVDERALLEFGGREDESSGENKPGGWDF